MATVQNFNITSDTFNTDKTCTQVTGSSQNENNVYYLLILIIIFNIF
jgi:hypothetical protein